MMMQQGNTYSYYDFMEFPAVNSGGFDTGIVPTYDTWMEVCFAHRFKNNADIVCIGSENSLWSYRMAVWAFSGYISAAKTSTGGGYGLAKIANSYNKKLYIKVENNISHIEYDGSSNHASYETPNPFSVSASLIIGGIGRVGNKWGGFIGDFYYAKIYEGSRMIADYRAYADNQFINILNGTVIQNFVIGGSTYARNKNIHLAKNRKI